MAGSTYERLYRADLPSFAKFAFNELSTRQDRALGFHGDVMADALLGCLDRGITRLIITASSRASTVACATNA